MEDSSPALAGFLSGKMLESELLEILAFRLLQGEQRHGSEWTTQEISPGLVAGQFELLT